MHIQHSEVLLQELMETLIASSHSSLYRLFSTYSTHICRWKAFLELCRWKAYVELGR
jgi:hypothetical protein